MITDLEVGMTAHKSVTFTREMVESFISLVGDDALFHIDSAVAAKYGFKERIVHGLLVQAPLSAILAKQLPGPRSVINSVSVKFHSATYVNDEVNYALTVSKLSPAVRAVSLSLEARVGETIVLSGSAICTFPLARE